MIIISKASQFLTKIFMHHNEISFKQNWVLNRYIYIYIHCSFTLFLLVKTIEKVKYRKCGIFIIVKYSQNSAFTGVPKGIVSHWHHWKFSLKMWTQPPSLRTKVKVCSLVVWFLENEWIWNGSSLTLRCTLWEPSIQFKWTLTFNEFVAIKILLSLSKHCYKTLKQFLVAVSFVVLLFTM